MTITTLERIELPDIDMAIECDDMRCTRTASLVIDMWCCPRLTSEPCKTDLINWFERRLRRKGRTARCFRHPGSDKYGTKLSDFIYSVQRL